MLYAPLLLFVCSVTKELYAAAKNVNRKSSQMEVKSTIFFFFWTCFMSILRFYMHMKVSFFLGDEFKGALWRQNCFFLIQKKNNKTNKPHNLLNKNAGCFASGYFTSIFCFFQIKIFSGRGGGGVLKDNFFWHSERKSEAYCQ